MMNGNSHECIELIFNYSSMHALAKYRVKMSVYYRLARASHAQKHINRQRYKNIMFL